MMMNNADSNEQSNADVLRAADILSPYNRETGREQDSQKPKANREETSPSQEERKHPLKDISRRFAKEKLMPVEYTSAEGAGAGPQRSEIPKFDLAKEIMAEQRKITAIKRKAPGKETEASSEEKEAKSIGYAIEQLMQPLPEQQIIAEIVARDIEKLCKGGTLGLRGQYFKDRNKDPNFNLR